jgi:DNA-binding transcriptional LysR family regulator
MSVLPRYLIADDLASGRLVALLDPELPPINTLYLAIRTGTDGQAHIAMVRACLLEASAAW